MTTKREFKFACPVCHQHILCDASAAGSQVECPTCFRGIIIPKAPGYTTTRLILRGTHPKVRPSRPATEIKPASEPVVSFRPLITIGTTCLLLTLGVVLAFSQIKNSKSLNTSSADTVTSQATIRQLLVPHEAGSNQER